MAISSGHVIRILELVLLMSQIGLSSSQGHLSGVQDGQVSLIDRSRQTHLPNVLTPNSHIDLPGEHGNMSPHPVIHRHSATGSHASNIQHSQQHGNDVNGVSHGRSTAHVDLLGQHGNNSPFPAVHRHSGTNVNLPGRHGSHVDLPGQHGNESPLPAIHRHSGSHLDLPGRRGNESPFPAVHRLPGSHVDLPGQHGNESPHPAVHRLPGSHVDLPGQHGNESPLPALHRDVHASGHHDHAPNVPRQRFIDPVSGTPVIISAPNNNIPMLANDHLDVPNQVVHSHSLETTRVPGLPPLPGIIGPPPVEVPLGIPLMPLPIGVRFPDQRGLGRPFGGPILPVPLGPPSFFVPPEVGLGRFRGLMRRPLLMRGLPPRFPFFPPPSSTHRRIRLGDIIAGAIGSLLRNISRP